MNPFPSEEMNPFRVLNLLPSFTLPHLEEHVLALQKQEHPDLFVHQPEKRKAAHTRFSHIVWAYEELKDKRKRSMWLLKHAGVWPLPHDQVLLEEMMDMEEGLSTGVLKSHQLEEVWIKAERDLEAAFSSEKWEEAGRRYMRLCALQRLQEQEKRVC